MIIFILTIIIFIISLGFALKHEIKQYRCKHNKGIRENHACNAICKSCGKNLGFIGFEENKIRRMQ